MMFLPTFWMEPTGHQPKFKTEACKYRPTFQIGGGGGDYPLDSKTVTPEKETVSVIPSAGYYGLSDVTVNPIPDEYQDITGVTATAGDVLDGKFIVANNGEMTEGTMPDNGEVTGTIDGIYVDSYPLPVGFVDGGSVTLSNSIELILGTI